MSLLELKQIVAGYENNIILKNFDINIEEGKLISLLGPSGCGKTTTLRLIAGFSEPKSGEIIFRGQDYTKVPTHKRNFGFVFQSYALFPHLSIYDNVAYGLKMRKVSKAKISKMVPEILESVDLKGLENRLPKELSGGQRQRVALARAIVIQPDLLLMDEPLSNLDAKLRVKMRVEIRRIQQELGITTIYVTHDQEECFAISDQVAIMNHGIIEQMDTPQIIYNKPKTEFIARFVGFENFFTLHKTVESGIFTTENRTLFEVNHNAIGDTFTAAVRPEDVKIVTQADKNTVMGKVLVSTYLGKQYQYNVETDLGKFIVKTTHNKEFNAGDNIILHFPQEKINLITK